MSTLPNDVRSTIFKHYMKPVVQLLLSWLWHHTAWRFETFQSYLHTKFRGTALSHPVICPRGTGQEISAPRRQFDPRAVWFIVFGNAALFSANVSRDPAHCHSAQKTGYKLWGWKSNIESVLLIPWMFIVIKPRVIEPGVEYGSSLSIDPNSVQSKESLIVIDPNCIEAPILTDMSCWKPPVGWAVHYDWLHGMRLIILPWEVKRKEIYTVNHGGVRFMISVLIPESLHHFQLKV